MSRNIAPPVIRGFEHVKRFWHAEESSFVAKVLPGEYYVSRGGELIATVLGSCVSACIRDPLCGVGGLNHFMLPGAKSNRWEKTSVSRAHRYGSYAMEHMINDILEQGAARERLEVKLVGGGRVLRHVADVGKRNIDFVHEYLAREGLEVTSEDLGDIHPRKVYYEVESGRLRVKKLLDSAMPALVSEEREYQRSVDRAPKPGDLELF